MSFKIKRWVPFRAVDMKEFVPGIKGYQTPGAAGKTTDGFSVPFRGKILVMAYAADDTPIWCVYDPMLHTVEGPHEGSGAAWRNYSAFHGWSRDVAFWRDQMILLIPRSIGYYFASPMFHGWTADMTFHAPPFLVADSGYMSDSGLGFDGSEPCMLSCQRYTGGDSRLVVKHTITGATVDWTGKPVFRSIAGSQRYMMKRIGAYYRWETDAGTGLYASPPESHDTPPLAPGPEGLGATDAAEGMRRMEAYPNGSDCLMQGPNDEWYAASAPLAPIEERPWATSWEYRLLRDGGYQICDGDVDGVHHGANPIGPGTRATSFNKDLGWYIGLSGGPSVGVTTFTVYVLDPRQHPGMKRSKKLASGYMGWMGDYALTTALQAADILPFPDEREPQIDSRPPQERNDGYLLGPKEVYRSTGTKVKYVRPVKISLAAYPHDQNWWFPGENPDKTVDGFLGPFAGLGPTVQGFMPDPMWGWLNPLGNIVARGLGEPTEHLDADPSHRLRASNAISGTATWATPGGYTTLNCGFDGETFVWTDSRQTLGSKPQWEARVGKIRNGKWTDIINFRDVGPPGLGETGWTVKSVVPIGRCKALPEGGYLVGATLYFAPWKDGEWEWTVGTRDATFHYRDGADTGQGWVPARPGWIGPLQIDDHAPQLLSAYDEWTLGRSLYGPDALLVYDHRGELVECLNNPELYPPDARNVIVTGQRIPKLIYRLYRYGTYSDFAEYEGVYCRLSADAEIQAPIFCVYDLMSNGEIIPGAGTFRGFFDMHGVVPKTDPDWRWSCAASIYDSLYPAIQWSPPGRAVVRSGRGGRMVVPLHPGPTNSRSGIPGTAQRTR